jgi:AcrR family transcriptional regulator
VNSHVSIFTDHVIDESATTQAPRLTRAEQRDATRRALVEATADCLVEEGYAALTTRRVAERAGVAQSTLMHHFATREALLIEAVTHLALQLVERTLQEIDLAALLAPGGREAVLDEAWREFTSPQALAAAQLWVAAWTEPELAETLRELEERIGTILVKTTVAFFPDLGPDRRLPALLDTTVSLIRGLVLAIPVSGREAVDARWRAIKPILLESASELLDKPGR